jgi:hypothetical protein
MVLVVVLVVAGVVVVEIWVQTMFINNPWVRDLRSLNKMRLREEKRREEKRMGSVTILQWV